MTLEQVKYLVEDFFSHFYVAPAKAVKLPSLEQSALKFGEECGELQGAIVKSFPKSEQEDEWADCLFALLHLAIIGNYRTGDTLKRLEERIKEARDGCRVINGVIVKKKDQRVG